MGEKRSELKCRVGGGVRSTGEDEEDRNEDVIGKGIGGFDFFGFQMSSEGEWYHAASLYTFKKQNDYNKVMDIKTKSTNFLTQDVAKGLIKNNKQKS